MAENKPVRFGNRWIQCARCQTPMRVGRPRKIIKAESGTVHDVLLCLDCFALASPSEPRPAIPDTFEEFESALRPGAIEPSTLEELGIDESFEQYPEPEPPKPRRKRRKSTAAQDFTQMMDDEAGNNLEDEAEDYLNGD
jgi:hypothetical protein